MHGPAGEEGKRRRHMWPVPDSGTAASAAAAATTGTASPPNPLPALVAAAVVTDSNHSARDFFLKDGRKIGVGDCALFQAGNSPPFIGIIRCFTTNIEDHLKLSVNLLYRPSDIKLAKGILLEAAPNEVFYSFHKDEISAKLLLHPCKVAFLHKGVELPSGISSFVCRRVYDVANKCLWWLTDKDYINERQEEVDRLFGKTQVEMHAAVQSGGRSPKQLNGPSSTHPLKSGSDSVQSSSTSFPLHSKGRKRGDKGDQGSDSIKRERSSRVENMDSTNCKSESMIKAEIAKICDKGGLMNNDAVERLVQLMQLDRVERRIDLPGRILLADVIAAMDRNDCLNRFVQLRGVPVLDDWLQEAHKGRNGDGTSVKEGDKSLEELLLAVLRALDKLPVNLDALQTCNIGKSVNHLRGHKNLEIQKKARSLVDTWKKRVDAEMTRLEMTKLSDTKSIGSNQAVSWSGKPGFSEVSYGGSRRAGSSDVAVKSAGTQPSTCKSLPAKIGHGDSIVKTNPGPSGSLRLPSTLSTSMVVGAKDSQSKSGGSSWTGEPPPTIIKEEKSSSSSQSQNNSQSCSSDHTKTTGSAWREDARSSTAGSMNASKNSGGTSRHRKSSNGYVGTTISGVQKENGLGKPSSVSRNATTEKVSQPGASSEKTVDVPTTDHGNNHRLIVRLPNPGRSPARSTSGGSFEDPSLSSRASSPRATEKNEDIGRKTKLKSDASQANIATDVHAESWQSNDLKCVGVSDEGDRSTTAVLDEERSSTDETVKAVDVSKTTSFPETKPGKSFEASLSSISALIESYVKCSEASASSGGDDSGMNLLASVAAGEISKSDLVSPTCSPGGNSPATEDACTVDEVRSTFSSHVATHVPEYPLVCAEVDYERHGSCTATLQIQDGMPMNGADSITDPSGDRKSIPSSLEIKSIIDGQVPLSTLPADIEDLSPEDSAKQLRKKRKVSGSVSDGLSDCKRKVPSPTSEGSVPLGGETGLDRAAPSDIKCEKGSVEGPSSCPLDKQNIAGEVLHDTFSNDKQLHPATGICPGDGNRNADNAMAVSSSAIVFSEVDEQTKKLEQKEKQADDMAVKSLLGTVDDEQNNHTGIVAPTIDDGMHSSMLSTSNSIDENLAKEVVEHHLSAAVSHEDACMVSAHDNEQRPKATCSKLSRAEADEVGEEVACLESSSAVTTPGTDTARKCDFDLNEGFAVDEGSSGEPVAPSEPGCSSTGHLPNLQPFTLSLMSSSSPVPITIASPAKGPFVPPEMLPKCKSEPGWKGSAATSAFRPAEPRRVAEIPLGMSDASSSEPTSGKKCRPLLDIDLNIPDERILEDIASQSTAQGMGSESVVTSNCDPPMRSSVGLDLDLNRADESTENGLFSGNTSRRVDVPLLPIRPASVAFPNVGPSVLRDFDLNNGPSLDEASLDQGSRGQQPRGSCLPFLPSFRMNSNELGNLSTWFPSGNSYPAVAIPSFLPDRGDQPFPVVAAPGAHKIFNSATGGCAFGSDPYRGPMLSSSPALAFSPAAAFSYTGFPFGSGFPLASTSFSVGSTAYVDSAPGGGPFPAIPATLVGSTGAASSPYVRPYLISLHEGSTSGGLESSQKWGQQNLDLNAGPGSVDIEGRVERPPLTARHLSVPASQAFTEEQARMYQASVGSLKRKEPEGGWDAERFTYK